MVYVVRDNWEGQGYRLYTQDTPESDTCCQVDGEINGKVYDTTEDAVAACVRRFKVEPILDTDGNNDVDHESFEGVERDGPQEEDYTTEDHRTFYQVGNHRGPVLEVGEDEDWREKMKEKVEADGFWPNIWFISDHGNAHLLSLTDPA